MNPFLTDYYRLPEACDQEVRFAVPDALGGKAGFFRLGEETIGYGQISDGSPSWSVNGNLSDLSLLLRWQASTCHLPFDPAQVAENLRMERYARAEAALLTNWMKRLYYLLRPSLPEAARKRLQQLYIRHRTKPAFPQWPIDCTVESLAESLLRIALKTGSVARIPFIWFWPDGSPCCAVITHDVETQIGKDFTPSLMDIDDSYGFKSAFMIVPEERYSVDEAFLSSIRQRGFEIGIQGLNHDGLLFASRKIFLSRVQKINQYGKRFKGRGFRSPVMYRRLEWYRELKFTYDMSVPNSARFEAQQGGCCTVMPYFIQNIVELPLTTTQDYALFHYLGDYSIDVWKRQIELILRKHGLISVLIHPDYVVEERPQTTYKQLLRHIQRLRQEKGVWAALPGEVADWWRLRSGMQLQMEDGEWVVRGEGSDRARVAFAALQGDQVAYEIQGGAGQARGVRR